MNHEISLSDFSRPTAYTKYGLQWPGKNEDQLCSPPLATLTVSPDKHTLIEGDNLHAMALLRREYCGRIRLIYMDPPYNTGSTSFVYRDRFHNGKYSRGFNDLEGNLRHSEALHSGWLQFMYPRLLLARELLADDGIIAVSIDDRELPRLRLIMDEIFGERNHYATVTWQRKAAPINTVSGFATMHDYVVFYTKVPGKFRRNLLPRTPDMDKAYTHDDQDGRGKWNASGLTTSGTGYGYPIINPFTGQEHFPATGRQWMMPKDSFYAWLADNRIYWGNDNQGAPSRKRYLQEVQPGRVPTTIWSVSEAGSNSAATKELRPIFGTTSVFSYPKPLKLLNLIISITTSPNEEHIILDPFAGSGTTPHAVLAANAQDGGNRRSISIQIPEKFVPGTEPYELGYRTLADVTSHRITHAAATLLAAPHHPEWNRATNIEKITLPALLASSDDVGLNTQRPV